MHSIKKKHYVVRRNKKMKQKKIFNSHIGKTRIKNEE